jgi:hypothetical protein
MTHPLVLALVVTCASACGTAAGFTKLDHLLASPQGSGS